MIRATSKDEDAVTNILSESFYFNQSVNYIIKQDNKKNRRIKRLMSYSFEICLLFGDVFLSDDKKACALIFHPEKKKLTFRTILLDLWLIGTCTGLRNIKKTLDREGAIKKLHSNAPMYYLWFIGVQPDFQGCGIGSSLLNEIIEEGRRLNKHVYLETSTLTNLPWYTRHGFKVYNELCLGYALFFLTTNKEEGIVR